MAVASHGSFTIAAKELNTSRTALGAMMDALEETLGERLFNRRRSVGISLTAAGELLLPQALSLLRDAESIRHGISNSQDLTAELAIGATVSLAFTVVPRLLQQLAVSHPRLRVQVVVKSAEELISMLDMGAIDLLLSYASSTPLRKLTCETLFETQFGLVAKKSDMIDGNPFDIRLLGNRPLAILDNAISRQKLLDYVQQANASEINIRYRVGTLPLCLDIIQRGLAWGIVPVYALMKEELPNGIGCFDLLPSPPVMPATVSWQADVSLSFVAQLAIKTLRNLRFEENW